MSRALLGALALLAVLAPRLAAQGRCTFQIDNVDRQGSVVGTANGTNYFAGGNVRLSCRGSQITMQSDSVAAYGGNIVRFIGHVKYRDSTLTMDADNGVYYKAGEKWEARGHVTTENLLTGSSLTGPSLDYYRVVKGVRDTLEMYATGRPKITYNTADSAGRPAEPYIIVGDRVRFKGSDRIYAGGKVTIDRSDLKLERRELTYLLARGNGHAVSRDWDLVADTIGLDVNNRKLEQTLAWGKKSRPVATSPAYAMKADSLALDTPAQRLTEVRGFGSAWLGGTVNQAIKDRDWMRGDTIVAHFTPVDSAGKTRSRLARIDARHGAQSYHIDANVKLPTRPSINYARGDAITVTMRNGDSTGVDRVDVRGKVDGVQLEASPDSTPPADSTRAGTPGP